MTSTVAPSAPAHHPMKTGGETLDLHRLAGLLRTYTPREGSHELPLPGVYAVRRSQSNSELIHGLYRPSICIVAQGAKTVFLGSEVYAYDESRVLMVTVNLPVASQITRASAAEPYLSLILELDPQRIAGLADRVYPHGLPKARGHRGICVGQADASLVKAAARLLELMADAWDARLVAPLALDELLLRLLRGSAGSRLVQIGREESHVHRIARAVEWIRTHYDQPMHVEELAELVHMGSSAFHERFRAVTSMSPLRFQKMLRLGEARRLMLSSMMDAGTAGRQVGYVSPSQFSREYARQFGKAPTRDIAQLRDREEPPLSGR